MKSAWIYGLSSIVFLVSGCWASTPLTTPDGGESGDGSVAGCEAQDARGEGACRALLGVVWDGTQCVTIGGCECVGADCLERFDSLESCESAYGQCLVAPPPEPCAAQDARGEGLCRLWLGVAFDGRACVSLGGCECVGADCDALYESVERCEAAHAECIAPPPPSCEAQTLPEGDCRGPTRSFGWRWDGNACAEVFRCGCDDRCLSLYASEEACRRDRAHCAARVSCDPAEVWCRALPPSCPAGQVPSVEDHCWGACVDVAACLPIACGDERPCPEGLRCSDGACR